ncbi:MAG: hypothetical protein JSR33_00700 [Proteobacteria bacterium]|nr:hypothetical protein [Pseudomonadota bacterium]
MFISEATINVNAAKQKAPLDAHERWHFDEDSKVQKLMRIIALCKPCHEVTHMGLTELKGRRQIATQHLMQVTGMNHLEAQTHIDQAFDLWMKRNRFQWQLDLSIITNSGIKLAQEFNAIERQTIAKNETAYLRNLDDVSVTNVEFSPNNLLTNKILTTSNLSNNNKIEINNLRKEPVRNSIKNLYLRIMKALRTSQ